MLARSIFNMGCQRNVVSHDPNISIVFVGEDRILYLINNADRWFFYPRWNRHGGVTPGPYAYVAFPKNLLSPGVSTHQSHLCYGGTDLWLRPHTKVHFFSKLVPARGSGIRHFGGLGSA